MAALLGRPLVIHEQNSIPGLANKVLAAVADRKLCAFPGALKDATYVGNPVRAEILAADPSVAYARLGLEKGVPLVVATGGGTGALGLNRLVAAAAPGPGPERVSLVRSFSPGWGRHAAARPAAWGTPAAKERRAAPAPGRARVRRGDRCRRPCLE